MKIRVRAEAGVARLMPQGRHELEIEIDEGETVERILDRLGIGPGSVQIVTVNREAAAMGRELKDGDLLSLMPMIVGG